MLGCGICIGLFLGFGLRRGRGGGGWLFRVEGGGCEGIEDFLGLGGHDGRDGCGGESGSEDKMLGSKKGELALGTGGLFLDNSLGHVRLLRKCLGGNFRLDDCGYPQVPWTRFLDELYFRVGQRHRNRSVFGTPKILEPL